MDTQVFTEDDLLSKKYGELLKIAKNLGVGLGRRLKTAKLIEAILEAQSVESTSVLISSEPSLSDRANNKSLCQDEEPIASEELISDVQFPQDLEDEITSSLPESKLMEDSVDSQLPIIEQNNARKRKGTFDVEETSELSSKQQNDKLEDPTPAPKRRRTSTFEVKKVAESNETASERICNEKVQENSCQLEALRNDISSDKQVSVGSPSFQNVSLKKVSLRSRSIVVKSKTGESVPSKPVEEILESVPSSTKPDPLRTGKRQSIKPANQDSVRKSGLIPEKVDTLTPRISRKSNVAATPKSVPRTPYVSRKSEVVQAKSVPRTPYSSRKSEITSQSHRRSGLEPTKLDAGTLKPSRKSGVVAAGTPNRSKKSILVSGETTTGFPKAEGKDQETSKILKPLFNVGRSNTPSKDGKETKIHGTGIPRFVSFARKLKVPNFAKIHERAFNRMEALDDYIDKKKKMLDNPGSGTKQQRPKNASGDVFRPSVTSVENIKINFTAGTAKSTKSPFSKTPKSMPVGKKSPKTDQKNSQAPKSTKKSPRSMSKPKSSHMKSPRHLKSPKVISKRSPAAAAHNKKITLSTHKRTVSKKTPSKPCHSNIPKPHKENIKPGLGSLASPAPVKAAAKSDVVNKPTSFVPYKGSLKAMNTAEMHKTMSEKIPPVRSVKERREYQNKILKGVRFNKRFELQMAKRGIDITQ